MHSCVHYLHHLIFDPTSLWEQARASLIVAITFGLVWAFLLLAMPEDPHGR
jgi:hypothetical protein